MYLKIKPFIAFCSLIGFTNYVQASQWDLSAGGGGRILTGELAAAVSATLGHGTVFWGQKTENHDPFYGYFRPYTQVRSSYFVNRAELGLDFFPISFAGITVGGSSTSRKIDLTTLDCSKLECHGELNRVFIRSKFIGGYDIFYALLILRLEHLSASPRTRPFGDDWSSLYGNPGKDTLGSIELSLGAQLPQNWGLGLQLEWMKMSHSRSRNDHESLYVRKKIGSCTITAGAGLYRSTTAVRGFIGYAFAEWEIWPSVALN